MNRKIKLVAFDLDGTLTQHKSPLEPENRAVLEALGEKYRLLMVGAGSALRIFRQLGGFPIDVIGNYGMQYGKYNALTKELEIVEDLNAPCDRQSVADRIRMLRERFGFETFAGESVEYHASGCVTFPILGTKAKLEDKLAYDPDRKKRRAIYQEVCDVFPEYTVFVGGSSSFDMAPHPFDKAYALRRVCRESGIQPEEVCYVGDDYGTGGNDESVFCSEFRFVTIDDYRTLGARVREEGLL